MSGHGSRSHLTGPPLAIPRRLGAFVQGLSFWIGVILPFCYVPLLGIADVVSTPSWLLLGAIAVNLLALILGHGYDPAGAQDQG